MKPTLPTQQTQILSASHAIWLVRHAQPLVDAGLCYGHLDVPADQSATVAAASQLAQRLLSLAPECMPHKIVVSELQRAQQLATALQVHLPQLTIHVDARLNEMNFGRWEGVAWDAIPKQEYDHWIADFAHYRFGTQESCQEMISRVSACYLDWQHHLQTQTQSQAKTSKPELLWICHAGVIRALQYFLQTKSTSIQHAHDWPKSALAFGEFTRIA